MSDAPAKRGRGRPRGATLPPGEARSLRMHLRLSEPERAALVAAAAGGEVTTWVREAALRAAKRAR